MQTLDSHRHFWHYNPAEFGWIADEALRRDFTPAHAASFDPCIAVEARQSEEETKWLISLAASEPAVRGVVGWLDIASDDFPSILEKYAGEEKLVALRHVVQDEPDDNFILGDKFVRGVRHLLREGYAYDILVFERQLDNATLFVDRLPHDARVVLDHMGKPADFNSWLRRIAEIALRSNVFVKLSGLVTELRTDDSHTIKPYLETVLEKFGSGRVMFGSDWPVMTVHTTYATWKNEISQFVSCLSKEEQEAVMHANAEKLYLEKY